MNTISDSICFPCALTIAGSDPSGGAGIQMDLQTFSACGVFGCSVISALTVQNRRGVEAVYGAGAGFVMDQIRFVLADMPVGAVKTGMLWDMATIRGVSDSLPARTPLVVDPVFRASSGGCLFSYDSGDPVSGYTKYLIPRARVFTPNRMEAEAILSCTLDREDDIIEAAQAFLKMGADSVVMKGGHYDEGNTVTDRFFSMDLREDVVAVRSPYPLHGTGCCFSAALASWIARGCATKTAFIHARECIGHAISHAVRSRSGWYLIRPGWKEPDNS